MLKSKYTKSLFLAGSISLLFSASCGPKGKAFDGSSTTTSGNPNEGTGPKGDTPVAADGAEEIIPGTIGNLPIPQVLCQKGPKVLASSSKGNFEKQFALICESGTTNKLFAELLTAAYSGTGEPAIKTVTNTSNADFVTNLVLAYAIKVPLENPSLFAEYKAHDLFAKGIRASNSEMVITVESRAAFQGKGSVEQVVLSYSLNSAEGAGILDKRRTEFNTYLLEEQNRDVTISSEVLLDEATNEQYHQANGLTIGIKDSQGQTFVIFLTDLIIKNRIDPTRMQKTLNILNGQVAKMVQAHVAAGKK